jgi:hypothetical protein
VRVEVDAPAGQGHVGQDLPAAQLLHRTEIRV